MPKRNLPEFYYDEKRQQYRKRITLPDGRKKDLYAKDKATLRRKVAELRRDIEEYGYDAENPTLAEYAIQWCARRLPGLSEARKSDYRNAINNHILPGLDGNKRLREISTADIDLFMASKADISSSLHGKITSTLKQLFAAAVRDGKLRTSPAEHVRAGGKKAAEKTPLSEGQQAALIKAVESWASSGTVWPSQARRLISPWSAPVPMCQTAPSSPPRSRPRQPSGKSRCRRPCSTASSRGASKTPMSFRRLWEIVENRTAGTSYRWDREKGHNMPVQRTLGEKITNHAIVCSLDFHCTPHQLRHTYITNLCASGLDIKKIQYLAGHANVQMTLNIYAHVVDNRPEDLFDDVCMAFGSIQNIPPTSTP